MNSGEEGNFLLNSIVSTRIMTEVPHFWHNVLTVTIIDAIRLFYKLNLTKLMLVVLVKRWLFELPVLNFKIGETFKFN